MITERMKEFAGIEVSETKEPINEAASKLKTVVSQIRRHKNIGTREVENAEKDLLIALKADLKSKSKEPNMWRELAASSGTITAFGVGMGRPTKDDGQWHYVTVDIGLSGELELSAEGKHLKASGDEISYQKIKTLATFWEYVNKIDQISQDY